MLSNEVIHKYMQDPGAMVADLFPQYGSAVIGAVNSIILGKDRIYDFKDAPSDNEAINRTASLLFMAWYAAFHHDTTLIISSIDRDSTMPIFMEMCAILGSISDKLGVSVDKSKNDGMCVRIKNSNVEIVGCPHDRITGVNAAVTLMHGVPVHASRDKSWKETTFPSIMYLANIRGKMLIPDDKLDNWADAYAHYVNHLTPTTRPGYQELQTVRKCINISDDDLVEAIAERIKASKVCGEVKHRYGFPIGDTEHEQAIRKRLIDKYKHAVSEQLINSIYDLIFAEARRQEVELHANDAEV